MSLFRSFLIVLSASAGLAAPAAAQSLDDHWTALAPDERRLVDAVAADLFAGDGARRGAVDFDALDPDAKAPFREKALEVMGVDLGMRFHVPSPTARDI